MSSTKTPASNTGVTFPAPPTFDAGTVRFDWMQATVAADPLVLSDSLAELLGAEQENARGLNGYASSKILKRDGETLARVNYGGGNGNPNVVASGAATDDFVPVLRAGWGDHQVTRFDSASDFSAPGGFEQLRAVLLELAGSRRSVEHIESTKKGVRSRTVYIGASTSQVRVRLYEKGQFERQKGHDDADADWFRLEAQIRPKTYDARRRSSELGPVEAWGQSPFLRQLAADVLKVDVKPMAMNLRRDPDYERALHFLKKQYGKTLETAMFHEGSWEAVGRLLGIVVAD